MLQTFQYWLQKLYFIKIFICKKQFTHNFELWLNNGIVINFICGSGRLHLGTDHRGNLCSERCSVWHMLNGLERLHLQKGFLCHMWPLANALPTLEHHIKHINCVYFKTNTQGLQKLVYQPLSAYCIDETK